MRTIELKNRLTSIINRIDKEETYYTIINLDKLIDWYFYLEHLDYIASEIEEYIDILEDEDKTKTLYISDIAFNVLEEANINGSITCSTFIAKKIMESLENQNDLVEEFVDSDFFTTKYLSNPEAYHVAFSIFQLEKYLYEETDNKVDELSVEETKDLLKKIIEKYYTEE